MLNIKGWGPWDYYNELPPSELCPEFILDRAQRITGFEHQNHPGDCLSNILLKYVDLDTEREHWTKNIGRTYGGEIPITLTLPYHSDRRFIGVNTRILYGYAMSDFQFIYTESPDGISGEKGVLGFAYPDWPYSLSFLHLASPGYEIDGMQLAIHHGDAVSAMRIHTRPI
ncbi:hypothetical protein [Bacillus thuringiensis]|uniref:hypothetical protein n=1 Tax=Bacillus thuringiensis TaxID=1428 RepID=UPI000BFC9B25|nr:hypothetical protein [Bacillus thuringiensis]PGR97561.1 hypothetical protein COC68_12725 [Bacillus thuringiensis]